MLEKTEVVNNQEMFENGRIFGKEQQISTDRICKN